MLASLPPALIQRVLLIATIFVESERDIIEQINLLYYMKSKSHVYKILFQITEEQRLKTSLMFPILLLTSAFSLILSHCREKRC